jgi:hypothetical protein
MTVRRPAGLAAAPATLRRAGLAAAPAALALALLPGSAVRRLRRHHAGQRSA